MKGKIVCEIQTLKTPPKNTNGAFINLKDGRILFTYSQNMISTVNGYLAFMVSEDQGATWKALKTVIRREKDGTSLSLNDASFARLFDGRLAIFYSVLRSSSDMRMYMSVSEDEGETWSEGRICTPRHGYFITYNDRVVRLSSGRLLFASAYHSPSDASMFSEHADDARDINFNGIAHFIYSDDEGETWQMGRSAVAINVPCSESGLQEPGVVELKPGILWGFARTDLGRHYEFFSIDGGDSWTQPEPSRFTGPCSPLCIKRMPNTSWLMAVWNPVPNYITQDKDLPKSGRFRLVYAVSKDNGVHWTAPRILEDAARGEFSHAAIHFSNVGALVSYDVTYLGSAQRHLIRIRLIPYSDL